MIQQDEKRLIKSIKKMRDKLGYSLDYINLYFDLVKELLEYLKVDYNDERLALTFSGRDNVSVIINQRYVIHPSVGILYSMDFDENTEFQNIQIKKVGYFTRNKVKEAKWISIGVDDLGVFTSSDKLKKRWKESVQKELERGKKSIHKRHHKKVIYDFIFDLEYRTYIMKDLDRTLLPDEKLNFEFSIEDLLHSVRETGKPNLSAHHPKENEERKKFLESFPIEEWNNMTLEKYALGLEGDYSRSNYSYVLEFDSGYLGAIGGGFAGKHKIFKYRDRPGWYISSDLKEENPKKAFEVLREQFKSLFEFAKTGKFEEIDSLRLGPMQRGKTLYIYFPELILPLYSLDYIKQLSKCILGQIPYGLTSKSVTLNRKILEKLREYEEFNDWTNQEIFLYIWWTFIEIDEEALWRDGVVEPIVEAPIPYYNYLKLLDENPPFDRINSGIERKSQVILFGPPGTGKTYIARRFALFKLLSVDKQNPEDIEKILDDNELFELKVNEYIEKDRLKFLTFHPSYSYEEFIEGYRPSDSGTFQLELQKGIFTIFCEQAAKDLGKPYIIMIDEINRGNLEKIFGELITLIEEDKRGQNVELAQSRNNFSIPPNIYLIATMNTADRSISSMDFALRRRFAFVEMYPNPNLLSVEVNDMMLSIFLEKLNERVMKYIGREKQIGHSYFMSIYKYQEDTEESFREIFSQDIVPLLEDYCFRDYQLLVKILGPEIVDEEKQILKSIIGDPSQLIAALIKEFDINHEDN
ncbi:MAG: 5-methylcytosine-specific restriction enzyme B [Candidatus Heimdallarchaeota archaeon LC_2]|nr:MAG: 5-methylcytosine-specific restriction enzyme B [Candidatus Heimdallarchaeota archaeon LC_2]